MIQISNLHPYPYLRLCTPHIENETLRYFPFHFSGNNPVTGTATVSATVQDVRHVRYRPRAPQLSSLCRRRAIEAA